MSFEQCRKITLLMSDFQKPWFFAGGWAIDLFIGKETRTHGDIEIALFRENQLDLKSYLPDWEFRKVINGEFQRWENEFLQLPIHEIHGSNQKAEQLEILLNEKNETEWIF